MVLTTAPLATLRLCRSFVFVGWLVVLVVVKYTSKKQCHSNPFQGSRVQSTRRTISERGSPVGEPWIEDVPPYLFLPCLRQLKVLR